MGMVPTSRLPTESSRGRGRSISEPTIPITLGNEAGNYVAIDIGGGRFAFYGISSPGALGEIAIEFTARRSSHESGVRQRLGGPHLHFHVGDAKLPLGAKDFHSSSSFDVLGALNH
jgi:hypothetical protein